MKSAPVGQIACSTYVIVLVFTLSLNVNSVMKWKKGRVCPQSLKVIDQKG